MSQERKPTITPERVGMLTKLFRQLHLVWELLKDSRVPIFPKLVLLAGIVYVVFPIDVVPDVILGLGQLDDLGVLAFTLGMFVELCPSDIVAEHRRRISGGDSTGEVVDSSYRVVDDNPPDKRN